MPVIVNNLSEEYMNKVKKDLINMFTEDMKKNILNNIVKYYRGEEKK